MLRNLRGFVDTKSTYRETAMDDVFLSLVVSPPSTVLKSVVRNGPISLVTVSLYHCIMNLTSMTYDKEFTYEIITILTCCQASHVPAEHITWSRFLRVWLRPFLPNY